MHVLPPITLTFSRYVGRHCAVLCNFAICHFERDAIGALHVLSCRLLFAAKITMNSIVSMVPLLCWFLVDRFQMDSWSLQCSNMVDIRRYLSEIVSFSIPFGKWPQLCLSAFFSSVGDDGRGCCTRWQLGVLPLTNLNHSSPTHYIFIVSIEDNDDRH